ncbi:hypothetical protein [Neisseria polysaccharea]|uniref:hypothetical protein n=1 Tax=Neisseria polysaccharea TaxID=489 RepID=UPI00272C2384|nr:hypothetical protein [Neisseria polysaccharea]
MPSEQFRRHFAVIWLRVKTVPICFNDDSAMYWSDKTGIIVIQDKNAHSVEPRHLDIRPSGR